MKYLIFLQFALSLSVYSGAQSTTSKKTDVLLLGTFHFANRGVDVAKFEDVNILSEKRQKEVQEVVAKLKKFNPTKIFVEAPVSYQPKNDSLLDAYLKGMHILAPNEIQQVGFRLAKECGLTTLYCADYSTNFPIDSVMRIMMANQQTDMLQYFQTAVQKEQNEFNAQIKVKSVVEMMKEANTEASYKKLAGAYFFFLKAGDKKNHAGSYLTSEQWRRNIYIYENILKNLDGKEERILVLYGATHAAFLNEMMKYNEALNIVQVSKVLE